MLPNWLYGKSKSKLASILGGGGGTPADYNQVKAQVTQNAEDILSLSDALDGKAALTQISNPNLLDNPWFTVNQRGQSSYIGENSSERKYTFDRWAIDAYSRISITANNDGTITISNTSEYDNQQFVQIIPGNLILDGKTYTYSLDVVSYNGTAKMNLSGISSPYPAIISTKTIDSTGIISASGTKGSEINTWKAAIILFANSSITIRAVKLELGSVSTLAMDTAPNYQQELAKCQRYFIGGKLESLYAYKASGRVNAFMLLPVTMRSAPVIVGTAGVYSLDDNSAVTGASIESPLELYSNGVKFPISGANDTLCRVFIAAGGGLSADL